MSNKTAPYGTWDSPITFDTVVSDNIVFDDVLVDPITKLVYHLEERPMDHGRCVIVDAHAKLDVLPSPYSARDFVHDYGGAPSIVYDGIVYFSNDSGDVTKPDNSIYAIDLKNEASGVRRVTPVNPKGRYANFAVHPKETHLLVTIREDYTNATEETQQNVVNTLCIVDTKKATVGILTHDADFYASPVFDPSGTKIAWQEWYLLDMPWEGGIVYVADVVTSDGAIGISNHVLVAGEKKKVSATFPAWINDTTLLYTSDGDHAVN
ncbi:hypothetical protein J3R82DRAFT_2897 [Butyriboletus roseoflavus]|nr:hypothetical protein J3R82DRAFT_2897 [Butyriboletus roseoflavus]